MTYALWRYVYRTELWIIQLTFSNLVWSLYRGLPLRLMSRWCGRLSRVYLPRCLRPHVIGFYVWLFGCRVDEAASPDLCDYRSLSDFFRRTLRPEVRPIDFDCALVCPCDGTILYQGEVNKGMLEQVKGITYCLSSFFGPLEDLDRSRLAIGDDADLNSALAGGDGSHRHAAEITETEYMNRLLRHRGHRLFYCTLYLSPGDYHRFHSPADWTTVERRYFPGDLFSVNPTIARRLKGLFNLNERAAYFGDWCHGFFSLTAVGATNVGSINVYCDPDLVTNGSARRPWGRHFHSAQFNNNDNEEDGVRLKRGQMIGDFNFGSTIVLVFEAPTDFCFSFEPGQRVQLGQSLGVIEWWMDPCYDGRTSRIQESTRLRSH